MSMKARLTNLEKRTSELEAMILFVKTPEELAEIENADLERLYPGKRVILFVREGSNNETSNSCDE
ncbi:MAG: hypothetical protein NTY00_08020 [Deltaproteobacteria bacterium]|nr:hypothetical protein [Deltaproteobacteria bacterium]